MPLINPGDSIQAAVDANPTNTSFCLAAGLHEFGSGKPNTTRILPKSGNIFTGQYGAILDGTAWTTSDATQAAFRSHLEGTINDVQIRNLTIQNMPQRAIHAWHQNSSGWVIEYCRIVDSRCGVSPGVDFTIQHNYIRCNGDSAGGTIPNGGYIGTNCSGTLFKENEFDSCGEIQKVIGDSNTGQCTDVIFRNNWFHDNVGTAIWYDGDSLRGIVEYNTLEDNGFQGVMYEISANGVISHNTMKRNGGCAVFISNSRDNEIYDNTMEDNFRGIILLVNLGNIYSTDDPYTGAIGWDLRNNSVHDNTLLLTPANTAAFPIANGTNTTGSGASLTPYTSNTKNNQFSTNHYYFPVPTDALLYFWGAFKTFAQWQSLGQDVGGSIGSL